MVKLRSICRNCNGFRLPTGAEEWCKCCGCTGCPRCWRPDPNSATCAGIRYGFADGDGGMPGGSAHCKACKQEKSASGWQRRFVIQKQVKEASIRKPAEELVALACASQEAAVVASSSHEGSAQQEDAAGAPGGSVATRAVLVATKAVLPRHAAVDARASR